MNISGKSSGTGSLWYFLTGYVMRLNPTGLVVDDEAGAYEAVKHLIGIGCKNIVHFSGPPNVNIGINRRNGYINALRDHNLPVSDQNIIRCDTNEEAAKVVPGLLGRAEKPDGIFAVNDMTAAAAMKIIKQHGFKVPGDIAIVGFTSGILSDITDPALTSVEQHGYIIGKEAVKLLIGRIERTNDLPFQTLIIRTELVIKESTKRH